MAATDRRGIGRAGGGDDDHRRRVRQDPLHTRCADLDVAGDLAPAGEHGDRRAGRAKPGTPGRRGSSTTNPTNDRSWQRRRSSSWPKRPRRRRRWPCTSRAASAFRSEAAATAYLVRARGWPLAGGDPAAAAKRVAQIVWSVRPDGAVDGFLPRRTVGGRSGFPLRGPVISRDHVTDDVRRRDRETGDNFDEDVHLAAGAAGYLAGELRSHSPTVGSARSAGASGSWRGAGPACRGGTPARRR